MDLLGAAAGDSSPEPWAIHVRTGLRGGVGYKSGHDVGKLRSLVLLEEVAGADDGGVRLTGCTRDLGPQHSIAPFVMGSESEKAHKKGRSK
jgi:hypothetical protein